MTPKELYKPVVAGDLEMRLSNIRLSKERGLPSLGDGERFSDIAKLVCFGPSLADNWMYVNEGEGDIWTVSGANTYLWKRNVTPRFHIESDARPHKAELLEGSCPDTTYLIASRCHAETFDILDGYKVIVYHIANPDEMETLDQVYPGEVRIPPAWTMGITAINALNYLGYQSFKIYAMDGSYTADGRQHPEDHPNEQSIYQSYTINEGRTFISSPSHMVAAESFLKTSKRFPKDAFQFIGDGMIPHMYAQL